MASSRRRRPSPPPGPPDPLPNEPLLRLLGELASRRRTRAFLVGGPVRDILLGRSSPDLDIAVEDRSAEIGADIARTFHARFVHHRRFLSGTVNLPDSTHIDVAQTRTETYKRPAALPSVKPASIEDDLVRRDFTINALALEITPGAFGRVIDPHSGRLDLANRVVRVLHDRSFIDDPTRAFRAIRFAIRLEFDIEPGTLDNLRASVRGKYPSLLTPERILHELRLICAEPLVLQMMEAVVHEGLIGACFGRRPPKDLLPGLQRLVSGTASPGLLFTWLLSCLPVTDRFPVTKQERDAARAVSNFSRLRTRLARARRPSTIYRLLRHQPRPALHIAALHERPPVARAVRLFLDEFSHVAPRVTGKYLRSCGLRPGPKYRDILDTLLYARLDGRAATREQEFLLARRLLDRAGK